MAEWKMIPLPTPRFKTLRRLYFVQQRQRHPTESVRHHARAVRAE